jgi:hypothetical protein
MLVYIFNFLDRQIMSILAIPIKADLNLSDTQLGHADRGWRSRSLHPRLTCHWRLRQRKFPLSRPRRRQEHVAR